MASRTGHAEVVGALLAANADPNLVRTEDGSSPVYMASQNGHLEVVQTLVAAGAATGTILTSISASDLWAACCQGHTDVVRFLIGTEGGRKVLEQPRDDSTDIPGPGTTPLQIAEREGHPECAVALREAGATV
jgi:ankyrin repeat protein